MKIFISLIAGLLFGIGLTVSQMVDPNKVFNFLDITGNWDASLAFVMGGALCVFSLGYFTVIKNLSVAKCGESISHEISQVIDKKLIIGATLFGTGWGMSGICPGPAIVNISGGEVKILVFVLVMIIGMRVATILQRKEII